MIVLGLLVALVLLRWYLDHSNQWWCGVISVISPANAVQLITVSATRLIGVSDMLRRRMDGGGRGCYGMGSGLLASLPVLGEKMVHIPRDYDNPVN